MALIQTIRKRGSLILVFMIGLGLIAFIMMDMTSGQQSAFGSNQSVMAEINGNKVDINEFSRVEQMLYGSGGGDIYANREQLWEFYLEKHVVEQEAEAIGLGVSKEELIDLQFGNNLSAIITSRFRDQATGQVNRELLNSYKQAIESNQLDPQTRRFWAHQEKEIIQSQLSNKIANMAAKGMYVPTWMAEMIGNDQNQKLDFAYVQIPFDQVDNSEVALSDADYQAYLKAHPAKFRQKEETRRLEYLVFDVLPSAQDSAAIRSEITSALGNFAATTDDSLFVEDRNGTFDVVYFKEDQVQQALKDTVFKMAVGEVYGPYLDGNTYKAAKVVDRMVIPDSVRARHILIRATPSNQPEVQRAFSTIDSLKTLIENGTHQFDSLAAAFGQDGTASEGGDLGFAAPNKMVKPFNDLIFYQAKPGKLYTVGTQFGVHLVEVTDRKYETNEEGVRLAIISEPILPSEETRQAIEDEALNISESYSTIGALQQLASERADLDLITSRPLKRSDYQIGELGTTGNAREIVRWAFGDDPQLDDPNVGDVSPELYSFQDPALLYTNKYVIAALKAVQPAGKPTVDQVREDLEPLVLNKKKAEIIMSRINSGNSLEQVAQEFGVKIDTANNVNFHSGFIPGIGAEPTVAAAAFNLELNEVSGPIEAKSGVYLVKPTAKPAADPNLNIPQIQRQQMAALASQVQRTLIESLKKNADVEDNRSRFY